MEDTPAPKQWHVSTIAGSTQLGLVNDTGKNARFSAPTGMAVFTDGALYVADRGNNQIRKIALPSGKVTTVAESALGSQGDANGTGDVARFNVPKGIAVSSDGGALYVADTENHRIRKIALPTGKVTTIAGSTRGHKDATGIVAQFDSHMA